MTTLIRVLMVDDEERFRETTRRILAGKGFDTILAENGEQAVEKLALNPHVVILDIRMPGMDGHEVLARIRHSHPDLPVIMLTGHGDKTSAEQALAQGASDYLAKPCDIDLLADRIRTVCQDKIPGKAPGEPTVGDVMIPISAYTTIEASPECGRGGDGIEGIVYLPDRHPPAHGDRSPVGSGHGQSRPGPWDADHPGYTGNDSARLSELPQTLDCRCHSILPPVLDRHVHRRHPGY